MKVLITENILFSVINKYGVEMSSKILGISEVDLFKQTGVNINGPFTEEGFDVSWMAYQMVEENKKVPSKLLDFNYKISKDDFVQVVEWKAIFDHEYDGYMTRFDFTIYATPFWDGNDSIPVELIEVYMVNYETEEEENHDLQGDYFIDLKQGEPRYYNEFKEFIDNVYYDRVRNTIDTLIKKFFDGWKITL
jgi:hypothetical protein